MQSWGCCPTSGPDFMALLTVGPKQRIGMKAGKSALTKHISQVSWEFLHTSECAHSMLLLATLRLHS